MKRETTKTWIVLLTSFVLSAATLSCNKESTSPEAAKDTFVPGGDASTTEGFSANIVLDDPFTHYFHEQSSFTKDCQVSVSDAVAGVNNDIYCILDAPELDFHFNKIGLNFNVPKSMCKYTRIKFFAYYNYEPGTITGGSQIVQTVHAAGATTYDSSAGNEVSADSYGVMRCLWDYTATGGPNCCEGTYTLVTRTYVDLDANPATPETLDSTSSVTLDYGGHYYSCLRGPAVDLQGDNNSFPRSRLYRTADSGLNEVFKIAAPIEKDLGANYFSSNYFLPSKIGGQTASFPPSAGQFPEAFYNPYYEIQCLDEADDYVARIRVLFRSWDTVAEFTAKDNPYLDPNASEGGTWEGVWRDRSVWTDLTAGYPYE